MGSNTPNLGLYKPASSETGWASTVNGNWDTLDNPLAAFITATFTDDSLTQSGRHLDYSKENVRAHGAVGNASHDDTPHVIEAIQAAKARGVGGSGARIHFPAGWYMVDGDAVRDEVKDLNAFHFTGEGQTLSVIAALNDGVSCAFGADGTVFSTFEGLTFYGRGKAAATDGFVLTGASRDNLFVRCSFGAAAEAFATRGVGDPENQNERNVFLSCSANDSDVGYHIDSVNSQGQLFLGGGSSGCNTAFWGTAGWAEFHSWFAVSSAGVGTAWKTDNGWLHTALYSCLDEAFDISFDLGSGPLLMHHTYLQGLSYTVKVAAAGGAWIDATNCHFNEGSFVVGDNSYFYDRMNTFSFGGGNGFVAGSNSFRHAWRPEGYYVVNSTITGNTANPTWDTAAAAMFTSPAGYMDFHQVQEPGSPSALYRRIYMANGGNLRVKHPDGSTVDLEA